MTHRERLQVTSIVAGYRKQDEISPLENGFYRVWIGGRNHLKINGNSGVPYISDKIASEELIIELDTRLLYWAKDVINYLWSVK